MSNCVTVLLQDIDDVQRAADAMYQQLSGQLQAMHGTLRAQLRSLELQLFDGHSGSSSSNTHGASACGAVQATYKSVMTSATSPMTGGGSRANPAALLVQHITADALRTPMRPSLLSLRNDEVHAYTPAACSPSPHDASAHSTRHALAGTVTDTAEARLQQQQRSLQLLQQSQVRGRGDSTPLQMREQTLPPVPTPTHVFATRASAALATSPASVMTTPSASTTTAAAAAAAAASHATPLSSTAVMSSDRQRLPPCHVLVAFKRHRVLRYRAPYYVAPGEYVVVGGDRGEDVGVVTRSWYSDGGDGTATAVDEMSGSSSATGTSPTPTARHGNSSSGSGSGGPGGEHAWADGVGEVLRVATPLEVTQLQGVQSELERRAVEVAQSKVNEHALPMRIVEAEYQFDRRKLTFYYQSQHRLDFRNLVRDLYKTFRARIWMQPDVAAGGGGTGGGGNSTPSSSSTMT